jgi:hypothetical protein
MPGADGARCVRVCLQATAPPSGQQQQQDEQDELLTLLKPEYKEAADLKKTMEARAASTNPALMPVQPAWVGRSVRICNALCQAMMQLARA